MSATLEVTDKDIFTAVRGFLLFVFSNKIQVVRGLENEVPLSKGEVIVITAIDQPILGVPVITYQEGVKRLTQPKRWQIQADIYGKSASDMAAILEVSFRSIVATEWFDENARDIQVLYCSDARNLQFINESTAYENRWSVDLNLQANQTVIFEQESALQAEVGIKEVDTHFPP